MYVEEEPGMEYASEAWTRSRLGHGFFFLMQKQPAGYSCFHAYNIYIYLENLLANIFACLDCVLDLCPHDLESPRTEKYSTRSPALSKIAGIDTMW